VEYDFVEFRLIAIILTTGSLKYNEELVSADLQLFVLSTTTVLLSDEPKPFKVQC
jgi:hypothetical protein